MNRLSQNQMQKMLQRLSPQQIQMIKLLELPTIQLEQRIKKEIEENPALDDAVEQSDEYVPKEIDIEEYKKSEDTPSYRLQSQNYSKDDTTYVAPISDGRTLNEYLNEQLSYLSIDDTIHTIATYIIGSLDRGGYLMRSIENIADDLVFNLSLEVDDSQVEEALGYVQSLEPRGIGARSVQEALLLQLKYMPQTKAVKNAIMVISTYFDALVKKHFDKIVDKTELNNEELRAVISTITGLSPKPANLYTEQLQSEPTIQITPDFAIENINGSMEITLNRGNYSDIKLNKSYLDFLASLVKKSKEKTGDHVVTESKDAVNFIRQKVDSAKWFIAAVKQRNATLILTMNAIVNFQYNYFLTGEDKMLKPMILKDISEKTDLDVSTISRVVNSKYVQTEFGIYSLKYFFSEAMMTSDGEEVSSREIKTVLKDCVSSEDKHTPYTDEILMNMLKDKGYKIARRTVAKYREMLNIPVARMRKEF